MADSNTNKRYAVKWAHIVPTVEDYVVNKTKDRFLGLIFRVTDQSYAYNVTEDMPCTIYGLGRSQDIVNEVIERKNGTVISDMFLCDVATRSGVQKYSCRFVKIEDNIYIMPEVTIH